MSYPYPLLHAQFLPLLLLQTFLSLFSCLVMSNSLLPHGLKHPCPSPSPRACSNSCPLSQWCHPTISSSVIPFSSWTCHKSVYFLFLLELRKRNKFLSFMLGNFPSLFCSSTIHLTLLLVNEWMWMKVLCWLSGSILRRRGFFFILSTCP